MPPWIFYLIRNKNKTYAGVSPYPERRLRQHNGVICGGAKYTTSAGPGWEHVCLVEGFQTKQQALQFEWAVKHCAPRNKGGIHARFQKLDKILRKVKWTSKACNADTVPLTVKPIGVKMEIGPPMPAYITIL
jgi:predicted GIY-YIG superfamily endonuclease